MKLLLSLFLLSSLISCATSDYRLTAEEQEFADIAIKVNDKLKLKSAKDFFLSELKLLVAKNEAYAMFLYGNQFLKLDGLTFPNRTKDMSKQDWIKKLIPLIKDEFGKAEHWYKKAADKNSISAAYMLKNLSKLGDQLERDLFDEKIPDFFQSNTAELNHLIAEDIKNFAYKNEILAQFSYAEELRDIDIPAEIEVTKKVLLIKKQAIKNAILWYEKAAKNDFTLAQLALVFIYYAPTLDDKIDIESSNLWESITNKERSIYWLKQLALKNNVIATRLLASLYLRKADLSLENADLAIKYYEKTLSGAPTSVTLDIQSKLRLAYLYQQYKDDSKNAFRHVRDIAKLARPLNEEDKTEIALSQMMLGVLYAQGKGVAKNIEKSKFWINKAQENGSVEASKISMNVFIWDLFNLEEN